MIDGNTVATAGTITATLSGPGTVMDGAASYVVSGRVTATIDPNGRPVGLVLVPNDAITPSGTVYNVVINLTAPVRTSWTRIWQVDSSPDPIDIGAVRVVNAVPASIYGLDSLADVQILSPANNNILQYNSSLSQWKNVPLLVDGGLATTTHAAGATILKPMRHATDCTAITDAVTGEICVEMDSHRIWDCQDGGDIGQPCGDTAGEWQTQAAGSGTVTSVGLYTLGSLFSITGSPITTSGSFRIEMPDLAARLFLAGPTSGSPIAPVFREIEGTDLGGLVGFKGDILIATDPNTVVGVPAGANGSVLEADSSQSAGVRMRYVDWTSWNTILGYDGIWPNGAVYTALSANRQWCRRVTVPQGTRLQVDQVAYAIGTADAAADLAVCLYDDAGTAKLAGNDSCDTATTGAKTCALSYTLTAGSYSFCYSTASATVQISRATNVIFSPTRRTAGYTASVGGDCPASITYPYTSAWAGGSDNVHNLSLEDAP